MSGTSAGRIQPPAADPPVTDNGQHSTAWTQFFQSVADKLTSILAGQGVTDGSDAAAGAIGEYISANAAAGTAGLAFGIPTNVASISLTAGDWDVSGLVHFTAGAANLAVISAWVNDVSAASPALSSGGYASLQHATNGFYSTGTVLGVTYRRFSSASSKTIYLGAQATFASGTASAGGFISARRVR